MMKTVSDAADGNQSTGTTPEGGQRHPFMSRTEFCAQAANVHLEGTIAMLKNAASLYRLDVIHFFVRSVKNCISVADILPNDPIKVGVGCSSFARFYVRSVQQ